MALNAKTENSDGSERQNWEATMALNVGTNDVMALNTEREYDSECQSEQ